ncbi:hypothetical protein XYCOK13_26190 [Xylanibacillus composti]|uniref:Uncharacterized protein n=1 Tax=Xylanibacillus composti TaxID=1572762 RepID=A0A8J4M2F0_9BACL|nr:hypothetical protein XYCOK13_26190 [Xylanibacillus composti]
MSTLAELVTCALLIGECGGSNRVNIVGSANTVKRMLTIRSRHMGCGAGTWLECGVMRTAVIVIRLSLCSRFGPP